MRRQIELTFQFAAPLGIIGAYFADFGWTATGHASSLLVALVGFIATAVPAALYAWRHA